MLESKDLVTLNDIITSADSIESENEYISLNATIQPATESIDISSVVLERNSTVAHINADRNKTQHTEATLTKNEISKKNVISKRSFNTTIFKSINFLDDLINFKKVVPTFIECSPIFSGI